MKRFSKTWWATLATIPIKSIGGDMPRTNFARLLGPIAAAALLVACLYTIFTRLGDVL